MKIYSDEDIAKVRNALQETRLYIVDTSHSAMRVIEAREQALAILDAGKSVDVVGYVDGRGRFFYKEDPHVNADHSGMPELYAVKENV